MALPTLGYRLLWIQALRDSSYRHYAAYVVLESNVIPSNRHAVLVVRYEVES